MNKFNDENNTEGFHLISTCNFTYNSFIHSNLSYKVKQVKLMNQKFMLYLCESVVENKFSFISALYCR